jgi:hypothetical protein
MRAVEEGPLKDSLWAHFTSTFRKGYLWAEDSLMPQFYGRFAQCVKDFQVRSGDTWVASFPKCGTPSTHSNIKLIKILINSREVDYCFQFELNLINYDLKISTENSFKMLEFYI